MDQNKLTEWVWAAITMAADVEGVPAEKWWPRSQGRMTTFSWALVLHAARERCGNEYLALHAPWHGKEQLEQREALVAKYWTSPLRGHHQWELLVDFAILAYRDEKSKQQLRVVAESEMSAVQDVTDVLYKNYAWDFVKLMLLQAPLRLFTCRVGTLGERSGMSRRDQLEDSLGLTVQRHRAGLRPGDELCVVIIPEDCANQESHDLRVGVLVDGELVFERPWAR